MAQELEDNVNVHYNIKKPRGRATLQRNVAPRDHYAKHHHYESGMGCSLSYVGILWSLLSFLAMGCSCVGYYLPYWLEGKIYGDTKSSLGVFRRCNYPTLEEGTVVVVMECGRYSTFTDIPTFWWKAATISIGVGCCLTIMVSFAGILACCMRDILTHGIAQLAGALQFVAGECGARNRTQQEVRRKGGAFKFAFRIYSALSKLLLSAEQLRFLR